MEIESWVSNWDISWEIMGIIIGMYSDQNTSPWKKTSRFMEKSHRFRVPSGHRTIGLLQKITPFLWFFQLETFPQQWCHWRSQKIPLVVGNTGIMYGNHMGLLGLYGIMYGIIDTGWQNPMISWYLQSACWCLACLICVIRLDFLRSSGSTKLFWIPKLLSIQLQWISHREFIERKSPTKESQDYPLVNIQKTMENHHFYWVNQL